MKKIFKKAMTVLGSVALIGATVGIADVASAAMYPSPFDSGSAVVSGANAPSSDGLVAANILSGLSAAAAAQMSSGTKVVSGDGDVFKFQKTSTKFQLGNTITGVYSSTLDKDELPTLLADGTYDDTNNDEFDFTQEITMNATQLKMFSDNDYADDDPTVGFHINSGERILTYTLDFTDQPAIADIDDTDITFMGQEYYVLSAPSTNDKLVLLDSASEISLSEGNTKTVTAGDKTYEASIDFISSSEVVLTINGENTNSLAEGQTYKLDNNAYVGVKDIRYSSKETGISSVKFSIGNGKLTLTDGSDLEINDDIISGLAVSVTNSTDDLASVSLVWTADDDLFITEDSEITMPGFKTIKLSFGGLVYPEEEEIMIAAGSDKYIELKNFPLKDSTETIPLLYTDEVENYTGIGKDASSLLRTSTTSQITFDGDNDDYFVASWDDGSDSESYLMQATSFKLDSSSINRTTIQFRSDGGWSNSRADVKEGDTFSQGSVDFLVGQIDRLGKSVVLNITNPSEANFYTLYSKEGLKVVLPHTTAGTIGYINFTAGPTTKTSWVLPMFEENKNGVPAGGNAFNATLGLNTQSPPEPSVTTVTGADATFAEIGNTDEYRSFVYSALATELLWDKGPDQKTLKVVYHGDEVAGDVYITSSNVGLSSTVDTGIMSVKDSETAKYAGKNIVVVGGSAINTVAAKLLGGELHGDAFTAATGVSAGGFLIQSFSNDGKIALLVAGYNGADTQKAGDYLVNNEELVDTTVGNKYVGTSATEAKLVVA
jgi:LysM repeat protein